MHREPRSPPFKGELHAASLHSSVLFFNDRNIPDEFTSSQVRSDGKIKEPSHTTRKLSWAVREPIMGWVVFPTKFISWSLNPQYFRMWLKFGDGVFKEVIKLEWGYLIRSWSDWCSCPKRKFRLQTSTEGRSSRHRKMIISKPRREASGETHPANTLVLDF